MQQQPDVQPSMLPNPPPPLAESTYIVRMRMRIAALTQQNRELKRTLAQLRRDLQACHHRMRKRAT
jgi:hypothetical protein